MRVLSRLFLGKLSDAHQAGTLQFFGEHRELTEAKTFSDWLQPLRHSECVVYAKRPLAGPEAVLAYGTVDQCAGFSVFAIDRADARSIQQNSGIESKICRTDGVALSGCR